MQVKKNSRGCHQVISREITRETWAGAQLDAPSGLAGRLVGACLQAHVN